MRGFLERTAFRIYAPLLVVFIIAAWVLALPYTMIDWQARRDHLRDIRELLSRDSFRDLGRALRKGGFL